MTETAPATAPAATTPTLVAGPDYATLRTRTPKVDPALLGQLRILILDKIVVTPQGTTYGTSTDGLLYPDPEMAGGQTAAKAVKNALASIAPAGTRAIIRVDPVDGQFRWVVTLAAKNVRKAEVPTPVEGTNDAE